MFRDVGIFKVFRQPAKISIYFVQDLVKGPVLDFDGEILARRKNKIP